MQDSMQTGSRSRSGETYRSAAIQHQIQNRSAEYSQSVRDGLQSLGVEITPGLDRLLTDRYGQTSLRRFLPFHAAGLGSGFGGDGSTGDYTRLYAFPSGEETKQTSQMMNSEWGSELAGVGYQFEDGHGKPQ